MTRTILIIFNLFLTTGILYAQQRATDTLYFEHNKYVLSETSKNNLNSLLENLNGKQILNIDLSGYTDSDGNTKYNLILSQKRTKAVLDYFITKGINAEIIKTNYYGETKPINLSEKSKNRRVEIVIETKEMSDTSKNIKIEEKKEIVLGNIFEKLKKEPQIFKCLGNKDIMIKGKEGTIVVIPANSLTKKNGEIATGDIDVLLEEFYKASDMISANLSTISNNEMLETGGMINILASYSGEQLTLKKGKEIIIQMVAKDNLIGMQTFVSENTGDNMNWKLPTPNHSDSALVNIAKKRKKRDIGIGLTSVRHFLGRFIPWSKKGIISEYSPYEGIKDTAIQNQLSKTDNLIINSNQLGWINCDRFPDIKNKTNVIVTVDTAYWPVVRLVFKEINSIMPGYYTDKKEVQFANIPVGYKLTIIAFSLVNNEPYYASKDVVIMEDLKVKLDLTKTTLTKLEEDLKNLN